MHEPEIPNDLSALRIGLSHPAEHTRRGCRPCRIHGDGGRARRKLPRVLGVMSLRKLLGRLKHRGAAVRRLEAIERNLRELNASAVRCEQRIDALVSVELPGLFLLTERSVMARTDESTAFAIAEAAAAFGDAQRHILDAAREDAAAADRVLEIVTRAAARDEAEMASAGARTAAKEHAERLHDANMQFVRCELDAVRQQLFELHDRLDALRAESPAVDAHGERRAASVLLNER